MLELSVAGARALVLAAQGLAEPPVRSAGKDDVLAIIRRMGALQIDTIHVVARSPYLVLWSRLGAYEPRWLDELLAEGNLFEYWSHAACFLPIEDFRLYRRSMVEGHPRWHAWLEEHRDVAGRVLAEVRARGEVRSADFERRERKSSGWWDWKPEKLALECLYTAGELMIARRDPNFHRVYQLRERVLPDWDDGRMPPAEETQRELALKTVRALGVTKARWVADYFKQPVAGMPALLAGLAEEGELVPVWVEGWDGPGYVHPENAELAAAAARGELESTVTTLLSPFDPVVWDRKRAEELFDFVYRIEVYTPGPKRRYGYFSLPILHRGRLIGRLDPKAYRKEGRFVVQALHLEPGVEVTDELIGELGRTLRACAAWHGTPEVAVLRSDPPELAELGRGVWSTG
jgi:uncharacterized protein YcaQ